MINLTNVQWCVFGLRGSGKSWLVKSVLDSTPSHLVYDPLDEHRGYRQYVPNDRQSGEELSTVIHERVIAWRPALFVIDEANKYVRPKPTPLSSGLADLADLGRHYQVSIGYVARRPSQFHTDVVELSDYLFIFHLTGKNDYMYLENIKRGLGDAVRALEPHHFAVVDPARNVSVHNPIDAPLYPHHT